MTSALSAISDPALIIPELIVRAAESSDRSPSATRPENATGRRSTNRVDFEEPIIVENDSSEADSDSDSDQDDRIITLDEESFSAAAIMEREDAAISLTAQLKASALVGFDAVTNRLLRLTLQYPVTFLVLHARLQSHLGCWPGPFSLTRKMTPLGLYRGFGLLAVSVSIGELAANAPTLLEFTRPHSHAR